ncbi:MAG: MBL fold metallo-hydrolase [candidate division Zixibacteria bacterium]|nr:MBL fold metallo-hydrolase [candidate division Zixibacteria bacterium]
MAKKLHTLIVGPFEVNCYLYWDQKTLDGVIIDPGAEAEGIIREVENEGFTPRAILLTHGHGDHIAAVAEVKAKYDIPLYIGAGEEDLLANPSANISAYFDQPIVAPPPDHSVNDEDVVKTGSLIFRVLSTPGHTRAGVCFLDETEGLLFTGDTLFAGGIGRTDLPGGSYNLLIESIRQKILALPDSVVCLPGHGPGTTVGAERTGNPFLTGGHFA